MIAGKRVLITGSNRGIGRETARVFARAGARVAINGRDEGRLESVRAEFENEGLTVIPVAGDISDAGQVETIIGRTVDSLGGLDVLINNAALAMRGPFAELTPGVVDRIITTNVSGTVNLSVAAVPHLRESRGSVVIISSLAGMWGFPLISIYAASKMALTAIAQSMRAELAEDGIHVGIVHVGLTQHDDDKKIIAVDGSPYDLAPRPKAQTQAHVAEAIMRLVDKRRSKTILTAAGHALEFARRVAPRLTANLVRRASRRVKRIAS